MRKENLIEVKLCECGCGGQVNLPFHRYIFGHHLTINNPSFNPKVKEKLSQSQKETDYAKGIRDPNVTKLCACGCGELVLKENHKWIRGHWNRTDRSRKNISNNTKGKKHDNSNHHMKRPEWKEWARKQTKKLWEDPKYVESMSGENSHFWCGGVSGSDYCILWKDKEYKQSILDYDNNECQNPYCWKTSFGLNLHHIDYDKTHCHFLNLITTCISCNSRANKKSSRKYWMRLYKRIREYGFNPLLMFER